MVSQERGTILHVNSLRPIALPNELSWHRRVNRCMPGHSRANGRCLKASPVAIRCFLCKPLVTADENIMNPSFQFVASFASRRAVESKGVFYSVVTIHETADVAQYFVAVNQRHGRVG